MKKPSIRFHLWGIGASALLFMFGMHSCSAWDEAARASNFMNGNDPRDGIGAWCCALGMFFAVLFFARIAVLLWGQPPTPDLSALDNPIYGNSRFAGADDLIRAGHTASPEDGQP